MRTPRHISILGGGPAGLAAGFFAGRKGVPFTLYESRTRTGGNSLTLRHGSFLFDSGAHRFHDRDAEITGLIRELMGQDLIRVNRQSYIWLNGNRIDFPIHLFNLVTSLGMRTVMKALVEIAVERAKGSDGRADFESYVCRHYGRTLARFLLLDYSEKLWGLASRNLARDIAGSRLNGLNARMFFNALMKTGGNAAAHMEGEFLYPRQGIGMITDMLKDRCDTGHIFCNTRITGIFHRENKIQEIEINRRERLAVDHLISTLPLTQLLRMMNPEPPPAILQKASGIQFRDMILIVLFIARNSVMDSATMYFPDQRIPFTRIHEPRNRSLCMAPAGKTSLVAEIPCYKSDPVWEMTADRLIETIADHLVTLKLCERSEIMDGIMYRMEDAYPILRPETSGDLIAVNGYLRRFGNLQTGGRNGSFRYSWIHDMIRNGKQMIDELLI